MRRFQVSTLAMVVIAGAVWIDDTAWWTRLIATAALLVCVAVDVRSARRKTGAR